MVFAALIGGLVGSRLDYILQNWYKVSDDLLGNIFSGSGLVWFGGLVGGALGVVLWAYWRGFLGWQLFDVAAVPLAIGYAIGRVGCQLSGDGDYGIHSDLPWAMAYPDGTVPTTDTVHPTPVYETLAMGFGRRGAVAAAGPLRARRAVRALPDHRRGRALPRGVHPAKRRGRGRAHPAAAHLAGDDGARRRDRGRARPRAARGDGLSAPPSAAAAHRASATEAPAAVSAWKETSMPTTEAATATAAPAVMARGRACAARARTATGGADQHREHEQRAEPLDGHRHRGGEQDEQREPHEAGPDAGGRGAGRVEGERGERAVERGQRRAAEHEQERGGHEVAAGHAERIAEEELLEPLRRVRREREQGAEADQPGDRDRGAGVGPDARVARGERDQRGGHERAAGRAEQQRRARRARRAPARAAVRARATPRRSASRSVTTQKPSAPHSEPTIASSSSARRSMPERSGSSEEVDHLHAISLARASGRARGAAPSPRRPPSSMISSWP